MLGETKFLTELTFYGQDGHWNTYTKISMAAVRCAKGKSKQGEGTESAKRIGTGGADVGRDVLGGREKERALPRAPAPEGLHLSPCLLHTRRPPPPWSTVGLSGRSRINSTNIQSVIQLLCRCQRNRSCLWGAQCPGGRGTRPNSIKEAKNALRGRRKRGRIKESSWAWTSEVVRHLIGGKV